MVAEGRLSCGRLRLRGQVTRLGGQVTSWPGQAGATGLLPRWWWPPDKWPVPDGHSLGEPEAWGQERKGQQVPGAFFCFTPRFWGKCRAA